MIISRAPVRITLGGGGTDLPSFYEKEEGFLLAGTINKYVFISINKQFNKTYKLNYSTIEEVNNIEDIKHNLFREALKLYDIEPGIEIHSMADIPGGRGLGSSGAFLVALLSALHYYKYRSVAHSRTLARDASKIEIEILKEHEGKQDKYISAFGGVKGLTFHKNGNVSVAPLINEDMILHELEDHLIMFSLDRSRVGKASDTLSKLDNRLKENDESYISNMNAIKTIGIKARSFLEDHDFDGFGYTLNEHWLLKKEWHQDTTNSKIDDMYKFAKELGALGGKTIGAPGGGFMIFYHPNVDKYRWEFIRAMEEKYNIKYTPFKFVDEGVTLVWGENEI